MDLNDNGILIPVEPSPAAARPHRRSEDTSEGCRSMASNDRERAEASDSEHMRTRLSCSAEAWTARANLLERLEGNRARGEAEPGSPAAPAGPPIGQEENDNG